MSRVTRRQGAEDLVLDVEFTLRGEQAQTLLDHAKRRGRPAAELITTIVRFVLKDDLVDAVIDDKTGVS